MLLILGVAASGLVLAFLLNELFPRAQFRGYDILPFFFIAGCQLITAQQKKPSFLPYGFFIYFILVILIAVFDAIRDKNISLAKTLYKMWHWLAACSLFWYIGLLFMMIW